MIFFTQITMEAAEDPAFLDAMRNARIKGALVGVEAVTPEGLKDVYKDFNYAGEELVERLQAFKTARRARARVVHLRLAERPAAHVRGDVGDRRRAPASPSRSSSCSRLSRARSISPPGKRRMEQDPTRIAGVPLTRHWLIPQEQRPKVYTPHPAMEPMKFGSGRRRCGTTSTACQTSGSDRAACQSLKARLAFVLISKLYRQMYANTGIATDSARVDRSARWARVIATPCRRLFTAPPMPDLQVPA